jgi:hypothetical protein
VLDPRHHVRGRASRARTRATRSTQAFDDARQTAKVANFGFPGGLGAAKLVLFARKAYGVELTEERARELKQQWLDQWPEMREYFAFVNEPQGGDGTSRLKQLRSGASAAARRYTAACNSFFQGLGADATGARGMADREGLLRRPRVAALRRAHRELRARRVHRRGARGARRGGAEELSRLMVKGASEWIPGVKLARSRASCASGRRTRRRFATPRTSRAWSTEGTRC